MDQKGGPASAQGGNEVGARRKAAGERALAEAEARRRETQRTDTPAREIAGRDGPEPVRYGDWEIRGLATDF